MLRDEEQVRTETLSLSKPFWTHFLCIRFGPVPIRAAVGPNFVSSLFFLFFQQKIQLSGSGEVDSYNHNVLVEEVAGSETRIEPFNARKDLPRLVHVSLGRVSLRKSFKLS